MNTGHKQFEDKFTTIRFSEDGSVMLVNWKDNCGNIREIDYEDQFKKLNERLKQLKPYRLLLNLGNCDYYVSNKSYQWYTHSVISKFSINGVGIIAVIVPENIFVNAMFAANQYTSKENNLKIQYFKDEEKAYNWLITEKI